MNNVLFMLGSSGASVSVGSPEYSPGTGGPVPHGIPGTEHSRDQEETHQ